MAQNKAEIKTLIEAFKIIYPICMDNSKKFIKNQSIENCDTITLIRNLKIADNYVMGQGFDIAHSDLATHPAQLNTCESKLATFLTDNVAGFNCDVTNCVTNLINIYGNDII